MSDELYHQQILWHARRPAALPEGADRRASLDNPFCGDAVTVALRLDGGRIAQVGYQGDGCAISKGSASMMTQAVLGLDAAAVEGLYQQLVALLAGEPVSLGELDALRGVSRYPVRRRCATLAWDALRAALR